VSYPSLSILKDLPQRYIFFQDNTNKRTLFLSPQITQAAKIINRHVLSAVNAIKARRIKKSSKNNEILALLQILTVNLALFQRMQLVCEGHLRSFTGKTYVRLWGTLACACGIHLIARVRVCSS
jgi:hypothetical protein